LKAQDVITDLSFKVSKKNKSMCRKLDGDKLRKLPLEVNGLSPKYKQKIRIEEDEILEEEKHESSQSDEQIPKKLCF